MLLSYVSVGQTVLTINKSNIDIEEFKNVFYKNNDESIITKEYLDEYMDLFINFKLKVKEAEELMMDTLPTFINELEGYKKQLAQPYLRNKEFDKKMLYEAYERMLQDISASHILISLDEDAKESDVLAVYDRISDIRSQILSKNITFEDAAKKYSDDKSALSNNGNLGYFTAFMMVYDFETAAYNTEINKISKPCRTKYGYHIIKVNDIRDAVGTVKVAHIMFKDITKSKDDNPAKQKIYEIFEKLKDGEEFSVLAERFSEDRSTAVNGGSLPEFGVGKMVSSFEKSAFALNEIGEISEPFSTEYGWHIIQLLEKKEIGAFKDLESEIKKKIERDSRSELSKNALFDKLKKEYKVKNNVSSFKSIRKHAYKKVSDGKWNGDYNNLDEILFTINTSPFYIKDFVQYIKNNQRKGSDFDIMYQDFVNQSLLEYEKSKLEFKYPQYRLLLNEYREGILLFDLTNKKVWNKAIEDTLGLLDFFNNNSEKYMWEKRADATIYTCKNISVSRKVKGYILKKKLGFNVKEEDILTQINKEGPLDLQIYSDKFIRGENQYIDKVIWKKGLAPDINLEDGSVILLDINNILPSTVKDLKETRGKVISDYQSKLEDEWILELRNKYNFSIDKQVLYSILK